MRTAINCFPALGIWARELPHSQLLMHSINYDDVFVLMQISSAFTSCCASLQNRPDSQHMAACVQQYEGQIAAQGGELLTSRI